MKRGAFIPVEAMEARRLLARLRVAGLAVHVRGHRGPIVWLAVAPGDYRRAVALLRGRGPQSQGQILGGLAWLSVAGVAGLTVGLALGIYGWVVAWAVGLAVVLWCAWRWLAEVRR